MLVPGLYHERNLVFFDDKVPTISGWYAHDKICERYYKAGRTNPADFSELFVFRSVKWMKKQN